MSHSELHQPSRHSIRECRIFSPHSPHSHPTISLNVPSSNSLAILPSAISIAFILKFFASSGTWVVCRSNRIMPLEWKIKSMFVLDKFSNSTFSKTNHPTNKYSRNDLILIFSQKIITCHLTRYTSFGRTLCKKLCALRVRVFSNHRANEPAWFNKPRERGSRSFKRKAIRRGLLRRACTHHLRVSPLAHHGGSVSGLLIVITTHNM